MKERDIECMQRMADIEHWLGYAQGLMDGIAYMRGDERDDMPDTITNASRSLDTVSFDVKKLLMPFLEEEQ